MYLGDTGIVMTLTTQLFQVVKMLHPSLHQLQKNRWSQLAREIFQAVNSPSRFEV